MTSEQILGEILAMAAKHKGAVSAPGLAKRGVSSSSFHRRRKALGLEPVFGGAYVVGAVLGDHSLLHAMGLGNPEGAVARHSSLHEQGLPTLRKPFRFVVPHGARTERHDDRYVVHETRHLPSEDVIEIDGLRHCTIARSLCDVSASESRQFLQHLAEIALAKRLVQPADLIGCLQERRRRRAPGIDRLGSVVAEQFDDQPFPESWLELNFFTGLDELGLDGISRQWKPPWYDGRRGIVDGCCPVGRTILEADGRGCRQTTQAHNNDRQRDRTAAAHGYLTIRVGAHELKRARVRVLEEVRDIVLERRRIAESSQAA